MTASGSRPPSAWTSTETPREQAFCAHAILTPDQTLIVEDARRDPRFATNPLVTGDPGIRFYAGAPLTTIEGHGLGSLCVIDPEPRVLTAAQVDALEALSRLVMAQLESRRDLGVLAVAFAEREVTTASARDYEERFRLAFENASMGMSLTAPDGRLVQVNARNCDLVGRREDALLGSHFADVTHPELRDAELRVHQRLLSGDVPTLVREKRYLRPDGSTSWGKATTSLIRSPEGTPLYLICQIEDVTERKLAEQAFVSVSIVIVIASNSDSAEIVIRDADAAMYRAKAQGRSRYVLAERTLSGEAASRLDIDTALHRALAHGEFRLLYQPTVRLADGTVDGVEALLRWDHPERGLVSPDEFIPLIEDNGLIEPIGEWVVHEACAQLARWRGDLGDQSAMTMAVNLNPPMRVR